jgi:hydroxyacylglutathione hydrolase
MHVASRPPEPWHTRGGGLEVRGIPVGEDNYSWLAICRETGEAAVVDGIEADPVLECAAACGARLTTVLNTHTHGDHVGINRDLQRRGLLSSMRVVGPAAVAEAVPGITDPVDEGDEVRIGQVKGRVLRTDGHLDGHVCFLFGDALFCGDTLFAGGCGYLFSGPPAKMFDSLMRLAVLPGETRVFCAHEYTQDNLRFAWSVEPDNAALAERIRRVWALRREGAATVPSTIALEQATNPFLRPGSKTLQRRVAEELPDVSLMTFESVFAATRRLKDLKRYRALGDDRLPG